MSASTQQSVFDVTVVCVGSRWRLLARGELDLRTGHDLVEVAGILAASRVPAVDLDLADVSFIDTAGWRAVGDAQAVLRVHGAVTTVVTLSPSAIRLVEALAPIATDR